MQFRAMGTDVTVHAPGDDEAAITASVARCFEERERIFSRFRENSELSELNRAKGPRRVSQPLFDALASAQRWHALTDGLFDPGIGRSIVALGYDRSFAPGALDDARPAASAVRGSIAEVALDERERTVLRPPHVQIDLGGMIKGRTVDDAVSPWRGPLSLGGLPALAIDAGGDAVLVGDPDGDGWLVDVEDPHDSGRVLLTMHLRDRSVATSAANRRVWRRGGERLHHLVDPRTGRPSGTDLAQATVIAPTTEAADVLAKTAFLLGARECRAWLAALPDVAAVLVRADGRVTVLGDVEVSDDRAA